MELKLIAQCYSIEKEYRYVKTNSERQHLTFLTLTKSQSMNCKVGDILEIVYETGFHYGQWKAIRKL